MSQGYNSVVHQFGGVAYCPVHGCCLHKRVRSTAAIQSVKADACVDILMRQNKYLNNIVEQAHRVVKRVTDPMLGFKSFWSARTLIAGIETMHMIKKGQMNYPVGPPMSAADQFYSLAV